MNIVLGIPILLSMLSMSTTMMNEGNPIIKKQVTVESQDSLGDDLTAMMHRYTAYNYWADQQFANWLGNASEADLNRAIESSFSSLKATILHIWSAEYLWLQIVKGESAENNPAKNFSGSTTELFEGWLQASENFSQYVNAMSLADFQTKRERSKGKGDMLIAEMIHHCMNHSTYHRGQLITMGRQAAKQDPPRTDYIYYIGLSE